MSDKLYSFVFRGLLTEEALDKAGRANRHKFSQEEEAELMKTLCYDDFDEDLLSKAKKMSVVYTAICAFENTVRDFVSKVLLDHYKENWWTNGVQESIRTKAQTRKDDEDKIRWHTHRGDSMINYTEFGDLVLIMKKNENWPLFEPHIISIDWASQIVKSLERSRNVIMHSGELANEDIERIGTNIRDWIKQVGS